MAFPFFVQLTNGAEKDFGTVKMVPLGTVGMTRDGRRFKYCKAGGTELAAGLLNTYLTSPTAEDVVTVAHAIGTTALTVDAVTADDYEDGYLVVNQGTGIGEMYPIKSNTTTVITLFPEDGLKTAWSISDTDIELFRSPYIDLVVNPVDAQQAPVCVTPVIVTASNYFWGQVEGYCALLIDSLMGTGGTDEDEKAVYCSVGTNSNAGHGKLYPAHTSGEGMRVVAWWVEEADLAADGDAALVKLCLD